MSSTQGRSIPNFQEVYPKKTLNSFKRKVGTGVRPNQFEVRMTIPQKIRDLAQDKGISADYIVGFEDTFSFLCKGAQIPAATQGEISVNFRGRAIKIAGDKTFDNWSTTVINDGDFSIRRLFEIWHSAINRQDINMGIERVEDYQCDEVIVAQLGRNGGLLRAYSLYNVWPVSVDAIDLSSDTNDTIQEFGLTLSVQHWDAWTPDKTRTNPKTSDLYFTVDQLRRLVNT